ncbi:MAG TPA: hypothetical protein VLH38_02200 [Patescibacteria group bacterium]|nr:hypothetical protein [Patescibacteria group bacterium]
MMSEQTTQAVVTGKQPTTLKRSIMPKLVIGAIVAVIIIVAGTWLVIRHHENQPATSTGPNNGLNKFVNDAQEQAAAGDNDAAHKTLNAAIKSATDTDQKRDLYVQQGITYSNQQQYVQAMESFRQAEQLGITATVAQLIAQTAQTQGDNQLAITYYKKTIALLDPKSPLSSADKQSFEDTIRSLGGQP